jgi:hypothetical protein
MRCPRCAGAEVQMPSTAPTKVGWSMCCNVLHDTNPHEPIYRWRGDHSFTRASRSRSPRGLMFAPQPARSKKVKPNSEHVTITCLPPALPMIAQVCGSIAGAG